jgi:hypothetical protein
MQLIKTLVVIEAILIAGLFFYRFMLPHSSKSIVDGKVVVLTLTTPAVALLVGNSYVFFAYLAAAIGFTSRTRVEASRTYLVMLPMVPALVQQTIAADIYILPLSATNAMSLGALIAFFATSPAGPRKLVTRHMAYDLSAIFIFFLLTYMYARGFGFTGILRLSVSNAIAFGGPYLLLSRSISTRADLERVLLTFGLPAVLVSLVATFEARSHWILYQSFYDVMHVPLPLLSATLNLRGGLLRTGGPIIDYTAAGIFLAVMLVVVAHLWPRYRPGWRWMLPLVLVLGLASTQSRGAWVAAVAGVVFLFAFRGHWAKVAWVLAGSIAMQLALIVISRGNANLAERVGSGGASAETAEYRKRLFWRGLEEIRSHPIGGQTPDQLQVTMADMVQGQHIIDFVNAHLYVAIMTGVPMFVVWVTIWILPVVRGWSRRRLDRTDQNLAEVSPAIIVTVSIALVATSFVDRSLTWLLIALAIAPACYALAGVSEQARAAKAAPRKLITGRV